MEIIDLNEVFRQTYESANELYLAHKGTSGFEKLIDYANEHSLDVAHIQEMEEMYIKILDDCLMNARKLDYLKYAKLRIDFAYKLYRLKLNDNHYTIHDMLGALRTYIKRLNREEELDYSLLIDCYEKLIEIELGTSYNPVTVFEDYNLLIEYFLENQDLETKLDKMIEYGLYAAHLYIDKIKEAKFNNEVIYFRAGMLCYDLASLYYHKAEYLEANTWIDKCLVVYRAFYKDDLIYYQSYMDKANHLKNMIEDQLS